MHRFMGKVGAALFLITLATALQAAPSDITWTEGKPNPVSGDPGFGGGRTYYASVLYDASAGKYRMWFDSSSGRDIGYGESTGDDPTSFGKYALVKGLHPNASKSHVIQLGADSFRMWYAGPGGTPGYEIRTAVSIDGINWTDDVPITGIVPEDADANGPNEHFAVTRKLDGTFYALAQTVPEIDGSRIMNAFTSTDGIAWTLQGPTDVSVANITSIVDHPDRPNTLYAFGYANDQTITSHVSTDAGKTWQDDEESINNVGDAGTAEYNVDRNYNPQAIYRGEGRWVLFRTVAEPKRTAYATGVEANLPPKP